MSSSISLGSIAVGFLAAAITLMPSLSNNELVKNLKRLGAPNLFKFLTSSLFESDGINVIAAAKKPTAIEPKLIEDDIISL